MASAEILSEVEIEITVGATPATQHKTSLLSRSAGPVGEKLIVVTGASGFRIDLSSFPSVRHVILENLSSTKYVRVTWTDAITAEVVTATVALLQTVIIPSPALGTSAVPLLALVPETGATCLCRIVVIGGEA